MTRNKGPIRTVCKNKTEFMLSNRNVCGNKTRYLWENGVSF